MKRAVYERITPFIESLPPKYTVNTPDLYATTSPETRQATKAHNYSVDWIVDHRQPEIVNGSTGKTINDNTSRLSKKCRKYFGCRILSAFGLDLALLCKVHQQLLCQLWFANKVMAEQVKPV